ncbi:hypothetical protein [Rhizobium oryzicola]|uniref:Transposase n=1 Tax=Rhizobium oryzicola TaxID=1232668 RepID=A0ABT8T0D6_9HYPH|nr:hypothetical protein [Rhizobium oryzicola]MDO1583357.1 hypothetical protein [Rhizobium oryzicola]
MSRMNSSEVAPDGAKALYGVHHYVTTKTKLRDELNRHRKLNGREALVARFATAVHARATFAHRFIASERSSR